MMISFQPQTRISDNDNSSTSESLGNTSHLVVMMMIFIGTRYIQGPIYGSRCLKLTNNDDDGRIFAFEVQTTFIKMQLMFIVLQV